MGLRINQNTAATNAYRNLNVSDGQMAKSLEKLSSGFRINRAADDAAGLSISEGMRSQIGGLKVAVRNAQDGISVVQTAEGALTEVHSLLQRARDLSVQSANTGGNDSAARSAASTEVDQIINEVNRISAATQFGGKKLLDGSTSNFTFQVGSGTAATDQVTVNIASMSAAGLGLTGTAATAASGTLAGAPIILAAATVAVTYNTGATGAAAVSSSFTVAAGTYDTTTATGRDTLQAALTAGIQSRVLAGTSRPKSSATAPRPIRSSSPPSAPAQPRRSTPPVVPPSQARPSTSRPVLLPVAAQDRWLLRLPPAAPPPSRHSTRPSRACRPSVHHSVLFRTALNTPSQTSTSRWKTSRLRSPESVTPTWQWK